MSLQEFQTIYEHTSVGANDFVVAGSNKQVVSGKYFLSYNYIGSNILYYGLIYMMNQQIDPGETEYSYYNSRTGRVGFHFSATKTVTWNNTALRNALGFTGNLSGAADYVAPNPPKYSWRPSMEASMFIGTLDLGSSTLWFPNSKSVIRKASDGTVYSVQCTVMNDSIIEYEKLAASEVLTPPGGVLTTKVDFQTFWTYSNANGYPVVIVFDRDAQTLIKASGLSTSQASIGVMVSGARESVGFFGDMIKRVVAKYNGLWDVSIPLMKYNN